MLDLENIDRNALKNLIKEILTEEPELIKPLITEVLVENDLINLAESEPKTKRFEMKLDDDLESFGDVFKAIA